MSAENERQRRSASTAIAQGRGESHGGAERRTHGRWSPAARCTARVGDGAAARSASVEDLSSGGVLLGFAIGEAELDLAPGAICTLAIELGPRTFRCRARRAWSIRDSDGRRLVGFSYETHAGGDDTPAVLDLASVELDPALALRVPASLALRRRVLPLCTVDGAIHVACADPSDTDALHSLERYFDLPLLAQQADPDAIVQVLRRLHGETRPLRDHDADDPVALCDELLHAAWVRRASDIHIDPEASGLRLRLRVDGQLEDFRRLHGRVQAELLSRIKILAGMDIAERRAPQDGRFTHEFAAGQNVDIRVATLPTRHGERATLRLLAIQMESLTLEHLGMNARDLAVCEREIQRPHGLILATGPTGCGKTTTLYAALRRILAARSVNAIAVQDPVEYDLAGVAQVEVDSAQKITFPRALRSILRHDPDVILIGEIRDEETVDIAIKAALTGHLVLATLHTNSAASAVTRLADMGADRYLIGATLRLVIAQRLVRKLCPYCRTPAQLAPEEAELLGLAHADACSAPAGCVFCAGRGYHGRAGVFELLALDDDLRRSVCAGVHELELGEQAQKRGQVTLRADALQKLASGVTSAREVIAAVAT